MQDELKGSDAHWNWLTARPGGASMPFAWDEPLAPHRLRVHVSLGLCCAGAFSGSSAEGARVECLMLAMLAKHLHQRQQEDSFTCRSSG